MAMRIMIMVINNTTTGHPGLRSGVVSIYYITAMHSMQRLFSDAGGAAAVPLGYALLVLRT